MSLLYNQNYNQKNNDAYKSVRILNTMIIFFNFYKAILIDIYSELYL